MLVTTILAAGLPTSSGEDGLTGVPLPTELVFEGPVLVPQGSSGRVSVGGVHVDEEAQYLDGLDDVRAEKQSLLPSAGSGKQELTRGGISLKKVSID